MRYSIAVWVLVLAALLTTVYRQGQTAEEKPAAKEEPLLLLDDDPPLLLDNDGGPSANNANMADNSRCHVCHLNFETEDIAVVHARENIGCPKCHGDCDEHIADESWAIGGNGTAPGKMYYRKEIDAACGECHEEHDVPAQKVIALWLKRQSKMSQKSAPERSDPEKAAREMIVCTDCHGKHKIHLKEQDRKCKWK